MSSVSNTNQQNSPFNTALEPEAVSVLVENTKQFILGIQNEAEININGLLETRDLLIKAVQEKINHITHIRQIRIEGHYHISHNINVASLSVVIGIKMGLRPDELKRIALAGIVHDVGKIKIPLQILLKPDKLTEKEYELVKLHVPLGYKIVRDELKLDALICRAVLEHHECYDGSGYPRHISGQDLHIISQILAVSDTFDALSSNRVYAKEKTSGEIVKEMLSVNYRFSPQALYTLIHMIKFSS